VRKNKLTWTADGSVKAVASGVRALTREDIGVVFQPIVDVTTGKTFAFEALVRCKVPQYASPPVLFEAAVAEGACGRLGRLIRDVAFATCGETALFVNIHPDELSSRWLVQPDDPIGFHSKPTYLEITETSALTHFDLCKGVLTEVAKRTGARLVVDDFGAGHSNLERVVSLEPAMIKLDLTLTRDIQKHRFKQTVVRHMVNMSRDLGADIVAEGVETLDELHCVRDMGVRYAQGYLIARPAAPPPAHAWPPVGAKTTGSKRPTAPAPSKSKRPTRPAR
jgi:EAL domain-containing protein (putative c-di-GMP-specific phosphodiesterase class I)